ncbi:MAG: CvpA family protein [Pyrinomonadaceae bacterium]
MLDLLRWIGSLLLAASLLSIRRALAGAACGLGRSLGDQPAAFLLIVVVSGLLIHALSHMLLGRLPRDIHKRRVNRVLGVAPGFVNGVITAAILSALLLVVPLPEKCARACSTKHVS